MIRAKDKAKGVPRADVVCDGCGRVEVVTCDYERRTAGAWKVNQGQVNKKAVGMGWEALKGKHFCPTCAAARRAERPKDEKREDTKLADSNVTEIRKPTREQKREIVEMLSEVYDTSAGRYRKGETDATVASVIEGAMPGWVSEIREDLFGPDGANDDLEDLRAELSGRMEEVDKAISTAEAAIRSMLEVQRGLTREREDLSKLASKADAIKTAVGPRAQYVS